MTTKECCRIDAIVTVDAKGQIVLPKDLREKAKIKPNDKLAVIGFQQGSEKVCCIVPKRFSFNASSKNL
jgi:antitoxin PrlF